MRLFLTLFFTLFLKVYFSQLPTELDKICNDESVRTALIGISVKDAAAKKILYEKNSHTQLVPASIFKLVTTLAALEKLGDSFRFKTEIYYTGNISNGTLNGNILIKGYGDPTVESRFFKNSCLQDMAQSIKKKGIQQINGKIILLNDYFSPELNGNWTYEDVNNYYAAIPYPFNIYDNEFHVFFKTEEPGQTAEITRIEPQYSSHPKILFVNNDVKAKEGGDNAYIYGNPLGYEKYVKGSVPPFQKEYSIEGALPDPPRMFAEMLLKKFQSENIRLSDSQYIIQNLPFDLSGAVLLHTVYSPPLSEIIQLTNLHSINLFAEAMLMALGNGNYEKGKKEILNFVIKQGVNSNEIYTDDACGLSRLNGISANAVTELLMKAYYVKNYQVFLKSLPVAGESGTMKKFTNELPLKGNLKCKTGYFQRVRSYAGYLNTKSGKTLAICIIYNNFTTNSEKIKQITKTFLESLYNNY